MLKHLIRWASAITMVVFLAMAFLQSTMAQFSYPESAKTSALVFFSNSAVPRDEQILRMAQMGRSIGLEIFLVTSNRDDYLNGVDVYSLGARQPASPQPIAWLDPSRHGTLYPAADLGDTNLNALYALRGSPAAIQEFQQWVASQGITTPWGTFWRAIAANTVQIYTGMAYAATLILLVALTMAWCAARAESRAVRLLAGTTSLRIHLQDLIALGRLAALPALAVALALGVALIAWRGPSNALLVGQVFAVFIAAAALIVAGCAVVLSMLTWPQVTRLARRDPPITRFSLTSELLKAVVFTLALASVPSISVQVFAMTATADSQAKAAPLRNYATASVGGITMTQLDDMVGPLGNFVAENDRTGNVAFAKSLISPEKSIDAWNLAQRAGYDAVILVNTAYLKVFGLDPATATQPLTDAPTELTHQINIWLRNPSADLASNGITVRRLTVPESLPIRLGETSGFATPKNPLLLVSTTISQTINDDTLTSFLTTGAVMFSDTTTAVKYARATGVTNAINGFSRVSDYALMVANTYRQAAVVISLSTIIMLLAVTISTVVAAHVFATRQARRIFAMRAYGRSWPETLKQRWLAQTAITITAFAVVSGMYLAGNLPWTPWLLVGLAAYLALVAALDIRASRAAFTRVGARIH